MKEVYEDWEEDNETEIDEYKEIIVFAEQLAAADDYPYGCTVISEDEFTDYCEETCKDCGYISNDFPSWIEIDWEATAENMKADYTTADYNGDTYYIR